MIGTIWIVWHYPAEYINFANFVVWTFAAFLTARTLR
jgi:hypothetical protein